MSVVGIPLVEQDAVFRTVAAVLHLGNVDFVEAGEPDSSQVWGWGSARAVSRCPVAAGSLAKRAR